MEKRLDLDLEGHDEKGISHTGHRFIFKKRGGNSEDSRAGLGVGLVGVGIAWIGGVTHLWAHFATQRGKLMKTFAAATVELH